LSVNVYGTDGAKACLAQIIFFNHLTIQKEFLQVKSVPL